MPHSPDQAKPAAPPATTPRDVAHRLGVRYLVVFVAVAALVAADQAIIQPLLVRMSVYAPSINLAGRQRMLSQRVAKSALAATADNVDHAAARRELQQALQQWSAAHRTLQGQAAATPHGIVTSAAIAAAWDDIEPHFAAMHEAAAQLAGPGDLPATPASASLSVLLEHEPRFLAAMERLVALMQDQAAAELARLRVCALAIAVAVIALLLVLGWTVVRPATTAIRRQVDDLESLVAMRTRELDAALASLRRELAERADVERRNQALAVQLAHADRVESLGRLAAGLAHEINQPLGAVANYAEAAHLLLTSPRREESTTQLQAVLAKIRESALRAGAIVRRMRNFVRPGQGDVAAVDIAHLVREVVDLCQFEASRSEIEIAVALPERAIPVTVDAIQIQQVLVNLVQNALAAMEHAPPQRRRLAIHVAAANGAVQVDVVDGGRGLAVDDPEELFAPFQTAKPDGLGLGLSICRSIVEQCHGTIWAKSLAAGAQFSFVLPVAGAADPPPPRGASAAAGCAQGDSAPVERSAAAECH
jgi:two-component system, LuxR family, sensor kinase FixL